MRRKATINKEERKLKIEGLQSLYLDSIAKDRVAEACLVALYDHHQCSDDYKEGDEIDVAGVGIFRAESIHIVPDNKEMMEKNRKKYNVRYEGIDGTDNTGFEDLEAAAKYVKEHWMGMDYCSGSTNFHNDYGQFYLSGFNLNDIGKFGPGEFDFEFNS